VPQEIRAGSRVSGMLTGGIAAQIADQSLKEAILSQIQFPIQNASPSRIHGNGPNRSLKQNGYASR
jgi:hypothetical protein